MEVLLLTGGRKISQVPTIGFEPLTEASESPRVGSRGTSMKFCCKLVFECWGFECKNSPFNARQCGRGRSTCASLVVFDRTIWSRLARSANNDKQRIKRINEPNVLRRRCDAQRHPSESEHQFTTASVHLRCSSPSHDRPLQKVSGREGRSPFGRLANDGRRGSFC